MNTINNYKYGVFVNGLLMNRFLTTHAAYRLIASFAEKDVLAIMREVCECGQIKNTVCEHLRNQEVA